MDGVHDLGGMHGFGRVEREENEPVFHARWEAAMWAINRGNLAAGIYNLDEFRHGVERMSPAHYLDSGYYEHWLDGIVRVLTEKGVITEAAMDERMRFFRERPEAPATAALDAPPPARRPARIDALETSFRPETSPPRYRPGDRVVTRTLHPSGHTRLPRYVRGKAGVIDVYRGVHVFPDANAHGQGEQPQPLYSVRFEARALWGESAEPNQRLFIDLWESYLLPG
ncbi:MAG: nitrile hydratase subunit beta [Candidatus Rokubacteria bacterium]|nr:nitrile hydratase subunit beta [Candidatus Rokubacteria bacterium]